MIDEEIIKELTKKIENSKEFNSLEKKLILSFINRNNGKVKIVKNDLVEMVKLREGIYLIKAKREFVLKENDYLKIKYFSDRPFLVFSNLFGEIFYREGEGFIGLFFHTDIIFNEGDILAVLLPL